MSATREVRETQRGCFASCGGVGCVLLLAAMFLPVTTCFAGSRMNGFEAAGSLVVMVVHGVLPAFLPIYATAMAVMAGVLLMSGRVRRGAMIAVLPAPVAAVLSASQPLQTGYIVWAVAVFTVSLGVVVMYAYGNDA